MSTKIKAAKGKSRTFEFQILKNGAAIDQADFQACTVVVDAPDGTDKFTGACPLKDGDSTTRLVTVTGAGTADAGIFSSCVHWTDAAGLTDAEPFTLDVYNHA